MVFFNNDTIYPSLVLYYIYVKCKNKVTVYFMLRTFGSIVLIVAGSFQNIAISKFLSKIYLSCVCRTHSRICEYTIYFANIIRLSGCTYSNVVSLGDYADMNKNILEMYSVVRTVENCLVSLLTWHNSSERGIRRL